MADDAPLNQAYFVHRLSNPSLHGSVAHLDDVDNELMAGIANVSITALSSS